MTGSPHPAYSLDDMADDAVGLLDALGIGAAHIVGASMGGFIAQLIAINHPDRALSLTSIMSGPGGRDEVAPWPELVKATRPIDRAYYPSGTGRQLVAILAAKSRMGRLRGVEIPTLVVHGVDDPLVPVDNGRLVADAVPGARLLEFEGMGHNMPEHLWPQVIDAIVETAGKASPVQPGAAWSS